jgi:hypothetical protein
MGRTEFNLYSPTSRSATRRAVSRVRDCRSVALQAAFERQTLKPFFSLDRLQVMGLKGHRLWDMGQLDSTCRAPPQVGELTLRGVAMQVEYLKGTTLKPGYHFDRTSLETRALSELWVEWIRLVQPHRGVGPRLHRVVALQVAIESQTLKPAFSLDRF